MTVTLGPLSDAQEESWIAMLEVSLAVPSGWCLVGGQMVHLHCWERGEAPQRPTDDADAVLDVRGTPKMLYLFTSKLTELGFSSAGESPLEGHQHRWVRGAAQIDVLIPTGLGETASARKGASGGTTLASPGAQQALDRAHPIDVEVAGASGLIRRPRLFGAMVSKAAAYTTNDPKKDRHIMDFAVLAAISTRRDFAVEEITKSDRSYLNKILGATLQQRALWVQMDGAQEGFDRLRLALQPSAEQNNGK